MNMKTLQSIFKAPVLIKLLFQAQIQILVQDLFLATISLSSSGLFPTLIMTISRFPSFAFCFTFRGQLARPMLRLRQVLTPSTESMDTADLADLAVRVTLARESMGPMA